jgi:tetratricopeptide (TPR) repeat protein
VRGVSTGPFVGRERAQSELERQWGEVLEGQRRVVMLSGEPGIGKTRLAAEFCRWAHAQGSAILAGRCYDEMLVPYQPFAEALRHYVAGSPVAEIALQVGRRRRELALLVPDLETPDGQEAPVGADAQQERFRLFDAVASMIADVAWARPTIVMLDDLQWADEASLLLLRHIVRATDGCHLMILGTYRRTELEPNGELAAALAELRRARAVRELTLEGLDVNEVASLISIQSGQDVPPRLTRQVAERTEGNPFFIEELTRHLEASLGAGLNELDLPDSVKDLLLRRLDRLADDCRRTLAIAAVAGRQFELAVLQGALGMSDEELVEQLEGAVQGQVVEEEPGTVGQYRFGHPLIRETIYGDISATRRALLHRRVAETLESLYSDRLVEHAGVLAQHYGAAGDAQKAFEYHREAANAAGRAVAYETMLEHFSGAIAAGESLGLTAQSSVVMADLHRRRAWAAVFSDADQIADRDYELALEGARAAGDRELEMSVLNGMGIRWHVLDNTRSITYHERALAIAEQLDDHAAQVAALNRLSLVYANELDFLRAHELGERALELARQSGDQDAAMRAMDSLKFVALQIGDTARLEQLTSQLELIQRERQEPWFLMWTLLEAAFVPIARCRWEDAVAKLDEAVAISKRIGDAVTGGMMLQGRCWAQRLRGEYGRALADGHESVALAEHGGGVWHGWVAMALAMTLRDLGAVDEAREALEAGFAAAQRIDARLQILSCGSDLAWLRWQTGDDAGALELLGRAESMLGEVRTPPDMSYLYTINTYTSAARTALAAGQPDRAEALMRYLHAARRSGMRYAVAEGNCLLSQCAASRGDADRAERFLAIALAEAGNDGLLSLRREIHARAARVATAKGQHDRAADHVRAAKELIGRISDSVGDSALADRFRAEALTELESSAPAEAKRS